MKNRHWTTNEISWGNKFLTSSTTAFRDSLTLDHHVPHCQQKVDKVKCLRHVAVLRSQIQKDLLGRVYCAYLKQESHRERNGHILYFRNSEHYGFSLSISYGLLRDLGRLTKESHPFSQFQTVYDCITSAVKYFHSL